MLNINNTLDSYLQNVEIKGNTIQNPNDLSDIKSVGDKVEGQELYRIPIKCIKANGNLLNTKEFINKKIIDHLGNEVNNTIDWYITPFIRIVGKTLNLLGVSNTKVSNGTTLFVCYYTKTREFITSQSIIASNESTSLVIPSNTEYLRMSVNKLDINTCYLGEDTKYEPYQEHKITILSPVQLEKVGDVADRIVEKDGVWGVEKKNDFIVSDANKDWRFVSENNSIWFPANHNAKIWSSSIKSIDCKVDFDSSKNIVIVKDGITNIEGYKALMPIKVIYQLAEPKFIPLPHAQQIKLRTFANQTNISFLTEIEGTIKADVAKSISASVNSNTQEISKINNRILDLEGLKEGQEMSYETDKGYLVCKETKAGTVKDLKIYGKSFVNKFIFSNNGIDNDETKEIVGLDYKNLIGSGKFSIPNISNKPFKINIYNRNDDSLKRTVLISPNSTFIIDLDIENAYLYNIVGSVSDGWNSCEELKTYAIFVQGEHSNLHKQITCFKGIASVGTGVDKIEVLSCNLGNLFINKNIKENTSINDEGVEILANNTNTTDYIPLIPNMDIITSNLVWGRLSLFDKNRNFVKNVKGSLLTSLKTNTSNCYYMRLSYDVTTENIVVNYGTTVKNYDIYKQDKKPLLFKDVDNVWKPISELRSCPECGDSVELSNDGKYYYYIRTEKRLYAPEDENNPKVITDKTNTIAKLAKEKVFEVNPLFLEAYENETMILCESGAVKPGIEWKITSYITNLVSTNTKRIKRIENDFYNYTVAQNRMMLSSRYNADRADFRIDNTLGVPKTASVELDYDLFELMKKVVIVGKDNYDRSKIEEQMDFYVTEGFIDWDMWDELFAIIELQHNPPVDLIPIEPISIEEPKSKKSKIGKKKKVKEI